MRRLSCGLVWSDLQAIESVSALTPAGRGGNRSGLRLCTQREDMFIPDVFAMRRDALRALMLQHANHNKRERRVVAGGLAQDSVGLADVA